MTPNQAFVPPKPLGVKNRLSTFSGNIAAGAIVLHHQVFMPGSSKIRHKAAALGAIIGDWIC